MTNWYFREKAPNEAERNPIGAEFFSDEAIERPGQALVREAVQNSLDARPRSAPDDELVSVRIHLSGIENALPAETADFWFGKAWPHLRAKRSGIRNISSSPDDCPFIVIEDFGTTGLEGDPVHPGSDPAEVGNQYYGFFYSEGVSAKSGEQGGRWGVGKNVFPRSSQINSFFGLTVRHQDGDCLLMGQAIPRFHEVRERAYTSDAWFCRGGHDMAVEPVRDPALLDRFRKDFRLSRTDQPGLSIVVPYFDPNIKARDIIDAAIQEYFFPILSEQLTLRITGPDVKTGSGALESDRLRLLIEDDSSRLDKGLRNVMDLAVWAQPDETGTIEKLKLDDAFPPEWNPDRFSGEQLKTLGHRFRSGQRLSIRVPLEIGHRGRPLRKTYFDIHIQRDLDGVGYPPIFIRNGIRIPKVKERQVRGHKIYALVIIEHRSLAELLGDAETPAHTHWSKDTQKFCAAEYDSGDRIIRFVSEAPKQLVEILSRTHEERDRLSLASFFPRPPMNDGLPAEPSGTERPGKKTDGVTPPKESSPNPFVVRNIEGGFRIQLGGGDAKLPPCIALAVAYDRRRGNPYKKYDVADFDLADLDVITKNCQLTTCQGSRLTASLKNSDFRIEVTGFDPHRDLIIDPRPTAFDS